MMTTKDNLLYFIYLHRTGLTVTALSAILLVWPLIESNPYNLGLSNLIAIYVIVVLGLNLFIGYAGQISLGHAAFFAIGAYGSAIGTTTLGGPAWAVMIVVAFVSFLLFNFVRDPVDNMVGQEASFEDREAMRSKMTEMIKEKDAELKNILTEEQWTKFEADRKERMQNRRASGGGRRGI